MNDRRLHDAFDDCLTRLTAGQPLEACLQRYPEWAAELRPALEAAQVLWAMSTPALPSQIQLRSRARFLAAAIIAARNESADPSE